VQSYLPIPSFLKSLFDGKKGSPAAKTASEEVHLNHHHSARRATSDQPSSPGTTTSAGGRNAMGESHYATQTHDEIMRYYDHGCVEVRQSGIHGYGVFSTKDLPKGSYVIEYIGRKMERATIFQVLSKEQGRYVFNLDEKWSIDGSVPENRAGRINHSCEGNCHIKKVDGHIWVVAKRDIRRGEELSYNYGYRLSGLRDMEKNWRCNCGASNCVGFILRKKDWPELKRKLQEREEMRRRRLQSLMDLNNKGKSEEPERASAPCHFSLVS
jgi:hypothetical protein